MKRLSRPHFPWAAAVAVVVLLGLLGSGIWLSLREPDPPVAVPLAETDSTAAGPLVELTDAERAWLEEHRIIKVAQDPAWPPLEFADADGEPSGVSGDYLSLLEQRLGIRFERVTGLTWQTAYERLQRWEIDVTTSVAVTAERTVASRGSSLPLQVGIPGRRDREPRRARGGGVLPAEALLVAGAGHESARSTGSGQAKGGAEDLSLEATDRKADDGGPHGEHRAV